MQVAQRFRRHPGHPRPPGVTPLQAMFTSGAGAPFGPPQKFNDILISGLKSGSQASRVKCLQMTATELIERGYKVY